MNKQKTNLKILRPLGGVQRCKVDNFRTELVQQRAQRHAVVEGLFKVRDLHPLVACGVQAHPLEERVLGIELLAHLVVVVRLELQVLHHESPDEAEDLL